MRVLTAKEVNFVSGGHIDGQADPYSLSGGFQGTGMPNTSGNSIGDVNYSPPTQGEACANSTNMFYTSAVAGGIGGLSFMVLGTTGIGSIALVVGFVASILGGLGGAANDCASSGSDSSGSSSDSDSGGSSTAPSTEAGG
jgi:hypothetical protein